MTIKLAEPSDTLPRMLAVLVVPEGLVLEELAAESVVVPEVESLRLQTLSEVSMEELELLFKEIPKMSLQVI